jgi:hypothetical protein
MGSTGTGRFTDYSNSSSNKQSTSSSSGSSTSSGGGSSTSSGGGSSGEDRCDQAFETVLEEVERCSYYRQNRSLPANGTEVIVRMQGRIGVETTNSELIGYLPTQYNYLASCIQSGRSYAGLITLTSSTPIVVVRVDIAPVSS